MKCNFPQFFSAKLHDFIDNIDLIDLLGIKSPEKEDLEEEERAESEEKEEPPVQTKTVTIGYEHTDGRRGSAQVQTRQTFSSSFSTVKNAAHEVERTQKKTYKPKQKDGTVKELADSFVASMKKV